MAKIINQTGINSNINQPPSSSSGHIDSFGRQRFSQPYGIFDNKFLSGKNEHLWDELLFGCVMIHGAVIGSFSPGQIFTGQTSGLTGTIVSVFSNTFIYNTSDNNFQVGETITTATGSAIITSVNTGTHVQYDYNRAAVYLKVGTLANQKVIRQTYRYFPYISGYSQFINTSQVFNEPRVGLKQTVMYGDDLNGVGIVINELVPSLLLRSNVGGTVVDTLVPQTNWNLDNMSGNGPEHGNPSGIKLDITKNQIQVIDFQWLGVGRVRMGFNIGGSTYYVHEFNHANITSGVYMRTPSLPIRYEIENVSATDLPSQLEQICCSVASEGGYAIPGSEFSVSHGANERQLASLVKTPVMAIRLKNLSENDGKPVRKTVKLVNAGAFARASDVYFELVKVQGLKTFAGSWVSVDDSSSVMVSKDVTALTSKHAHEIEGMMVPAGGSTRSSGADTIDTTIINNHVYLNQNINCDGSDLFVIYATSRSGTAYVSSHITWVEYE